MSRQRRQPPEYNWPDAMAGLLYSAGCTMTEVGRYCGVSKQCIQQRLERLGCRVRPQPDRVSIYPLWQRRLMRRVRDMGLNIAETAYLLSVPVHIVARGRSPQRPNTKSLDRFRVPLVRRAWCDCRLYILAAARLDGATYQELSDLAGWSAPACSAMALKRGFPSLPDSDALRTLLKLAAHT